MNEVHIQKSTIIVVNMDNNHNQNNNNQNDTYEKNKHDISIYMQTTIKSRLKNELENKKDNYLKELKRNKIIFGIHQ